MTASYRRIAARRRFASVVWRDVEGHSRVHRGELRVFDGRSFRARAAQLFFFSNARHELGKRRQYLAGTDVSHQLRAARVPLLGSPQPAVRGAAPRVVPIHRCVPVSTVAAALLRGGGHRRLADRSPEVVRFAPPHPRPALTRATPPRRRDSRALDVVRGRGSRGRRLSDGPRNADDRAARLHRHRLVSHARDACTPPSIASSAPCRCISSSSASRRASFFPSSIWFQAGSGSWRDPWRRYSPLSVCRSRPPSSRR